MSDTLRNAEPMVRTCKQSARPFTGLTLRDDAEAGGKGANLGELVAAGLPVPDGFVLLRHAYVASMRAGGVDADLAALHGEALALADDDESGLRRRCQRMAELVRKAGMTPDVRDALLAEYRSLAMTPWSRCARQRRGRTAPTPRSRA